MRGTGGHSPEFKRDTADLLRTASIINRPPADPERRRQHLIAVDTVVVQTPAVGQLDRLPSRSWASPKSLSASCPAATK
jgi:hypothetical protein